MKKILVGSAMASAIAIGAVVTMVVMFSSQVTNTIPEINEEIEEAIRRWQPLADYDPGSGNCGVVNIYIYPHQAAPAGVYNANLTEGNAYTFGHLNTSFDANGYVPYDTTFDIVVEYRYNNTVAYNTTGSTYEMDWIYANLTNADLGIAVPTTMSELEVWSNSSFIGVNFYMNNGGAGYTITHGESINSTAFTPYGYW